VDKKTENNHEQLRKFLGLAPDSTDQEVLDAIDDIAPLFAKYRNEKRGT